MTDTCGLDAAFTVRHGHFDLVIELTVPAGGVTAVVGPNGAGKSTAIRTIAGLLRPDSGRISSSGQVLDDTASAIHVPPARRGIGVVFQDYLLFPHLSAMDNVAFGLLAQRMPRWQATARAHDWLDRLGIAQFASSRPGALSGGQAQRVALARALVLEPSLLLLDEPLAALDASTRLDVRSALSTQLGRYGGATVIVTHDPIDALTLADEVVVLENGTVTQRGSPAEVARSPRNTYVADLLGLNLVTGHGRRSLVFSPADVELSAIRPQSEQPGDLVEECTVRGLEQISGRVRVRLTTVLGDHRMTAELDVRDFAGLPLSRGDRAWATVALAKLRES